MNRNTFLILFLLLKFTSCISLYDEKIFYNEDKNLFEYQLNKKTNILLRNENHELIDSSNIQQFNEELESKNYNYSTNKMYERDRLLRRSDYTLSSIYADIMTDMNSEKYVSAIKKADQLVYIYPEIYKFSDYHFIKGYAYEKLNKPDSAYKHYKLFLKYASGKYSSKFRGNSNNDKNDSLYIFQRNFANDYQISIDTIRNYTFSSFTPKYYHGSFMPGFTISEDDLTKNTSGILGVNYLFDLNSNLTIGLIASFKINETLDAYINYNFNNNIKEFSFGLPFQLYKSPLRNFGIKITPFCNLIRIKDITINLNDYNVDGYMFNVGMRQSIGYYISHNLALGAYYEMNFFNENRPYEIRNNNHIFYFWYINEYDISVYYNILKLFNFKIGIKNGDPITGIVWNGWETAFNFHTSEIILRKSFN